MKYFYSALVCLVLLLLEEVTTCKSLIVFGSHAREAFPFTNRTEQNRTSGFAASSMGAEACHYATTPPRTEKSGPVPENHCRSLEQDRGKAIFRPRYSIDLPSLLYDS
jgi:hypothetical protein